MADYGPDCVRYLRRVLDCYREAPFTPHAVTRMDIEVAERWYDLGFPVEIVIQAIHEVAFRMIFAWGDRGVRSLAYYLPRIKELHERRESARLVAV